MRERARKSGWLLCILPIAPLLSFFLGAPWIAKRDETGNVAEDLGNCNVQCFVGFTSHHFGMLICSCRTHYLELWRPLEQ